jgi:hypothetical protein
MAWTQKLIRITIALGKNPGTGQQLAFSDPQAGSPGLPTTLSGSSNTITFPFLRTSVRVANSGTFSNNQANIRIWGITPSQMYQLQTLGIVWNVMPNNTVTVEAGDLVNGFATVFTGNIFNAFGDFEAQPDVPFVIDATAGLASGIAPVTPSSFQGSVDVASIMSGFARQLGQGFQNAGVNVKLYNPYFAGTVNDQIKACADAAGSEYGTISNTLWIWPKGGSRGSSGINAPIISAGAEMIGYPVITTQGVIVKTLFNPQIGFGGLVQIGSSLLTGTLAAVAQSNSSFIAPQTTATGNSVWGIYKLDHVLDCMVPKGQWMSTAYCFNPGYPRPIPN